MRPISFTGLNRIPDDPDEILGLTDGKDYPFIGSKYAVVNMAKMLWRYGWDLVSLHRYTNKLLSRFDRYAILLFRIELNEMYPLIELESETF